ncbi:thioredoxin family protein [Arcticibacterium luteifluviistationis]|nr:thioredoxin family protein [Arcticibacterium luteifluviistationis]
MKKHIQNLKGISILIVLLAIGCKSNSQQANTPTLPAKVINESEISWKSSFEEALAEAKSRGELLFVECYSPTCQYCLALEPFFKEPEVAKKYNSNFINFKLNVTEAEQVKYLNERNIWLPSFPMFLYFDGDGNLVHQASADPNIASINGNADAALDPKTRASSFAKRFEDGERSIKFLGDYASFTRVIKDTTAGIAAANALFEVFPKDELGSEGSWELTKKAVDNLDNGFAQYWFNHVDEAAAYEKAEGHADNQNNILGGILQKTLYGPRGKEYDTNELKKIRLYMARIKASQYADNTLWEFETKANIREGNLPQALAVGNKMINTFKGNGSAYVYITRVFTDNFPDNSYVKSAKTWLVSALPTITQDNVRAEYYYELARLNQKDGESEKAKLNAKTAVDLATKIGTKLEKFNTLYESIK